MKCKIHQSQKEIYDHKIIIIIKYKILLRKRRNSTSPPWSQTNGYHVGILSTCHLVIGINVVDRITRKLLFLHKFNNKKNLFSVSTSFVVKRFRTFSVQFAVSGDIIPVCFYGSSSSSLMAFKRSLLSSRINPVMLQCRHSWIMAEWSLFIAFYENACTSIMNARIKNVGFKFSVNFLIALFDGSTWTWWFRKKRCYCSHKARYERCC